MLENKNISSLLSFTFFLTSSNFSYNLSCFITIVKYYLIALCLSQKHQMRKTTRNNCPLHYQNETLQKKKKTRKTSFMEGLWNFVSSTGIMSELLRENCPNTKLFLVRIFPHLSRIFSPKVEKYGPEITPYLDTFGFGY